MERLQQHHFVSLRESAFLYLQRTCISLLPRLILLLSAVLNHLLQERAGSQNQPGHPSTSEVTAVKLFIVTSLKCLMSTLVVTRPAHCKGQSVPDLL